MTATEAPAVFKTVPLDKLAESETNPRRYFDEGKLRELSQNIKAHGVLVPLLVRPFNGWKTPAAAMAWFEIVAGARRYRAAKLAGITEAPVRVVELSDTEALEVQVIENLQREDVHPLEEGEGFRRLLDLEGYTPELLAEKVNRDLSYIYKRLQLAKLIEPLKGKFLSGEIQIAHALVLCRLGEQDQILAAKEGLYEDQWTGARRERMVVSAKFLDAWVRQNVYLDLSAAPWKKDDPDLVPRAGACKNCPKRSGSNAHLFEDLAKKDVCLDVSCFQEKKEAHLVQIEKAAAARGEKLIRVATEYLDSAAEKKLRCIGTNGYSRIEGKKKKCAGAEKALVVSGRADVGRIIEICRDRACKTHHPYSSRTPRAAGFSEIWAEKKRKLNQKIAWETRKRVVGAILAKAPSNLAAAEIRLIGDALIDMHSNAELAGVLGIEVAKKKGVYADYGAAFRRELDTRKGSALSSLLLGLALAGCVREYVYGGQAYLKRLKAAAELLGVGQEKIAKATAAELTKEFAMARAKAAANQKKKKKTAVNQPAPDTVPETADELDEDSGDE
jgi:ParB family chromosome partitioning protein